MESEQLGEKVLEVFESPSTRGNFLKGAAATLAAMGIVPAAASAAGLSAPRSEAAMTESTKQILSIAATAEAAAVTALYHVHQAVDQGKLATAGIAVPVSTLVSIVRAALREEQDHYHFVTTAGGAPLYTSFSFPAAIFTNAMQTLRFFVTAETIFIGAYMAATREFASAGQGTLAQYAYQIGGVECEHRTLMRAGLGELPPNNKSFESNLYKQVAGAAHTLGGLGIFKPNLPYPGAAAVDHILASTVSHRADAGVIQRTP